MCSSVLVPTLHFVSFPLSLSLLPPSTLQISFPQARFSSNNIFLARDDLQYIIINFVDKNKNIK